MTDKTEEDENIFAKYVRRFDYFGVSIPFRMDGKRTYQSLLNGSVFIFFCSACLSYMMINFATYVKFKDFKYIFSQTKYEHPKNSSLKESRLGIGVAFTRDGAVTRDLEKYLDIVGEGVHGYRDNTPNTKKADPKRNYYPTCQQVICKEKKTLNMSHRCTIEDFYGRPESLTKEDPEYNKKIKQYSDILKTDFDKEGVSEYLCPNMTVYDLEGQYVNPVFNYYSIEISLKTNLTDKEVEEIKYMTMKQEYRLDFKFTDINLNVYNLTHPVTEFINSDFLNFDYTLTKKKNLFFEQTVLETDTNPIIYQTDDKLTKKILSIGPKEEYFMIRGLDRYKMNGDWTNTDPITIAKVYFRAGQTYRRIKRIYYKFTELIADTSSLIEVMFFMFVCLHRS